MLHHVLEDDSDQLAPLVKARMSPSLGQADRVRHAQDLSSVRPVRITYTPGLPAGLCVCLHVPAWDRCWARLLLIKLEHRHSIKPSQTCCALMTSACPSRLPVAGSVQRIPRPLSLLLP